MAPKSKKRAAKAKQDITSPSDSSMATVMAELDALHLTAPPNLVQTIANLAAEVVKHLRPGNGLLGTVEEESALYGPKDEVALEIKKDGADQDIGMQETTTSEIEAGAEDNDQDKEMTGVSFEEYQTWSKAKMDPDDEEALGDYEAEKYGNDYVEMPDGKIVPIWEYLGADWDARIDKLYSIQAMEMPKNIRIIPHDFQLKAAAQGLYCLEGPHHLFLLGDEMGVGKTLSSILMMWALRDLPGMSIVICPKNLCQLWVDTIHATFEEAHGLRAFLVDDSSITQAELLAGGYDILVCSYEFFESNGRDMHTYENWISAKANDQSGNVPQPKRPTSALHSEMWKILNLPFKIAALDEAQRVNKRGKLRHDALELHLHASSFLIISGTLPHNKWHNMSGYVAFGKAHPFTSHNKFLHAFSSFDHSNQIEHPSIPKMRLLQKFLQAFTIARPASILRLEKCQRKSVPFKLFENEEFTVARLTADYKLVAGIVGSEDLYGIDSADSDSGAFGLAVIAQMAALHPMLGEAAEQKRLEFKDFSEGGLQETLQDPVKEALGGQARDEWLAQVKDRKEIVEESGRLTTLIKLYDWIRKTYPEEKMIIFSSSLRFLDIVAEAFQRVHRIKPLRFDGTVPTGKRQAVEREFERCDPDRPLLITINAGGVGLNLQPASVVIIVEPQWNKNVELQAIARAYRQGQLRIVKALMMEAVNSDIDSVVLGIKNRKAQINRELMLPLVRGPGEGPYPVRLLTFPCLLPLP